MKRLLLAALLLLPARARAEVEPSWTVSLSTGASYVTDRSLDLLSDGDALPVADLRVAYSPGWLSGRLALSLDYVAAHAGGTAFQAWQTALTIHSLQAGAIYRQPVLGPLLVFGRAAGLVDFDRLNLALSDSSLQLYQWAVTGGALLAGGAELVAGRGLERQFGLVLEVGYALRFNPARFDHVQPDAGSVQPAPIAFTPVSLGSLNLSGLQWRIGAALHF